jgi:hypothetical protein
MATVTNCVKVGWFTKPNGGTGLKSVTGIGFRPSTLIIAGQKSIADGINESEVYLTLGFGDANFDQYCNCTRVVEGVVGANRGASGNSDEAILQFIDTDANIIVSATLLTMDADGFTLNFTINDPGAAIFKFIAFGGVDLEYAFGSFDAYAGTGNQEITGVGFQPDVCLFMDAFGTDSPDTTTFIRYNGLGCATGAGEEWVSAHNGEEIANFRGTFTRATDNACCALLHAKPHGFGPLIDDNLAAEGSLVSMNADGFTISWSKAWPHKVFYLAMRSDTSSWKAGTMVMPPNAPNVSVVGVGFQPGAVIIQHVNGQYGSADDIGGSLVRSDSTLGWGAADGIDDTCIGIRDVTATITGSVTYRWTGGVLAMGDRLGVPTMEWASFDADGFTVDFTVVLGLQKSYYYLCFSGTTEDCDDVIIIPPTNGPIEPPPIKPPPPPVFPVTRRYACPVVDAVE